MIISSFVLTGGINGASATMSLLVLCFFYASTESKFHWIWTVLSAMVFSCLVGYQYFASDPMIIEIANEETRFIDAALVYVVVVCFLYLTFRQIRKNHETQSTQLENQRNELLEVKNNLEGTNNKLTKILSVIGHDVRNPLASIESFLDIILDDEENLDEEMTFVKKELQASVRFTSTMLDDLTKWSKEQVYGQEYKIEKQALGCWLDETVDGLSHLSRLLGVELICNYDSSAIVLCDGALMRIVIRNLIQNAIKFTPEGKKVFLEVGTTDVHHVFEIIDQGVGMSEDQIKKLFTNKTESNLGARQEKGSGLGLLLVKEYVDVHQGIIETESQLNKGTKILIKIPKK